jgi:predicted dehydrogenase
MAKEKLRAAVIGTGMGRYHMRGYAEHPACELVAVCDLNEPEAAELAQRYGAVRVTTDYRDLVAMADLDLVSVAVPNNLHAEMTVALLTSGKHVLCEKPMAVHLKDAEAMVAAADRTGKRLMIDMTLRVLPDLRTFAETARSGLLGDVYAARGTLIRRKGVPRLDFPPTGEMARGEWFLRIEESGGGALVDCGVHITDLMWWAMGNPRPLAVCGVMHSDLIHPRLRQANMPAEVEDMTSCWIRFENEVTAFMEVTWDSQMREGMYWRLFGTAAGVEVRDGEPGVKLYSRVGERLTDTVVKPDPLYNETAYSHFVDCVLDPGKEMIASGQECLTVMRILDAIRRSAAQGGKEITL